jgi:hypothetical protein
MERAGALRKRPCRICRRWFMPDARLKDRQMTCADPECKRQWHRKKCAEWNKKNSDYFKANYLQKKLDVATQSTNPSKSTQPGSSPSLTTRTHLKVRLPLEVVQEVIGIEHLVIIEYFGQLLFRRFQEVLRRQVVVNTGKLNQLSPLMVSRGDRL